MFDSLNLKSYERNLTVSEMRKIAAFMLELVKQQSTNKIKVIFRGESYTGLKEKLSLDGDQIDYNKLSDFLFLVGEKGRGYRKTYRNKIKKKWKLFGVKNTEPKIFKYIFGKYNKLFRDNIPPSIENFKNNNPAFFDFFVKKSNEKIFIEEIDGFSNSKKLKVRDYYLTLLHHAGVAGYFNNSIYLSTTTDFNVARNFSGYKNLGNPVIIVGWIPSDIKNWVISFSYARSSGILLHNSKLPTYSGSLFPKQKELSLKGGIFPHCILGYIRLERNEMEINPHFFTTRKQFNHILKNGIDIDQTLFHTKLKETDYQAFFWQDGSGNYGDTI